MWPVCLGAWSASFFASTCLRAGRRFFGLVTFCWADSDNAVRAVLTSISAMLSVYVPGAKL